MYQTNDYEGMLAETVTLHGAHGDPINAYFARPLGPGPYPAVILIHHLPGWDAWYREVTRKFAHHGYAALSPNLYCREGHGTPEDVAAMVRGAGGVPDDQVVDDVAGALMYLRSLPYVNEKVGVFGTCSGGRHAFLAACRVTGFAAAVDCWGGRVVMTPGRAHAQAALSRRWTTLRIWHARSWASSARRIEVPRRNRWRGTSRSSRSMARSTSSTCIRARATASSTMTGPIIARSKRWTAGTRSLLFSASIWVRRSAEGP